MTDSARISGRGFPTVELQTNCSSSGSPEFAALIGVLSLQASVRFRLVCWILAGVFRFFVASFCLCEVFAKSLPKSLWSLAAFGVSLESAESR